MTPTVCSPCAPESGHVIHSNKVRRTHEDCCRGGDPILLWGGLLPGRGGELRVARRDGSWFGVGVEEGWPLRIHAGLRRGRLLGEGHVAAGRECRHPA